MLRRWGIAFVLSIAAHFTVVGGIVGALVVRGLTFQIPIDVQITGMRLDEVKDLPLGPPLGGGDPSGAPPRRPPRRRAPKPPAGDGELAGKNLSPDDKPGADEPEAATDTPTPRASSLRQYGPEGSRVTVLLRLDRLRSTVYAPALDALLGRLPDRRDLLDGTGLDLFQTFDALLIATPNPFDYTVTFLAARHRLKDAELRAALERGAKATGRVLTWRTEGHRPFAERHARAASVARSASAASANSSALASAPAARGASGVSRDERLVVLPAAGLVVVTPPTYRALLLSSTKNRSPTSVPDAGAVGDGSADGPARGALAGAAPVGPDAQWGALLRRIDAEDGIMPPDAVALLSAVDLFSARSLRGLDATARGRAPMAKVGDAPATTGTILGLPVPKVLTLSIGIDPSPFLDVVADLEDEAQARSWEIAWPSLRQRLTTSPYVLLTGFGPLAARITFDRSESRIHLRLTATEAETLRLLQLAARLLGAEPLAPASPAAP